jgi:hypothetical protein
MTTLQRTYLRLVGTTVLQHGCIGAVNGALLNHWWIGMFLAAATLNGAWWFNVGHRIDLHGKGPLGGIIYALTAGLSQASGAYLTWRLGQ